MSDAASPLSHDLVDLSSLRMVPDWVASFDAPSSQKKYEDYEPRERADRGDRRGGGGDRRGGAGGAPQGRRPERTGAGGGAGGGFQRREGGAGAGPRRDGPPGGERRGPGGKPGFDRGGKGGPRRDDRGAPRFFDDRPQLPTGLKVTVEPEDAALEMLAQHVKSQARAFSLFDAARIVLNGNDRHRVKVECEAERLVGLYQVTADNALFETKEEAVRYLLRNPAATESSYRVEEIEIEEPKGVFTTVAVCGLSGELLGPPSHHSFQTALKRLHNERYSNMAFDDYRRRVRNESNPELVEQWKQQQRKVTRWTYLKGEVAEGQEPPSFTTRADFETHFRRHEADQAIAEVRTAVVHATAKREQLSPGLGRLLRRNIEDAKKHLFELSQKIAQGLDRRGLKLFKRRGGKMFVSRVKPRPVEPGTVFTDRIAHIVDRIKAEPGITLAKLVEGLAPAAAAAAAATPAPALAPAPAAEGEAAPAAEAAAPVAAAPDATALTDDQKAVLVDLHWLTDAGYVIFYSDGVLFLGVQGDPPHHAPKAAGEGEGEAPATEGETTDTAAEGDAAVPEAEASAESEASAEPAPVTPLPSDEEEAAATESNEASALDSNPSAAD